MKDKIIEAAFLKFCEKGCNASLSEIGKMVGLRKQSIYNYFENKDALFYEMINLEITDYYENKIKFEEIDSLETEEKLKTIFFSLIKYFSNPKKSKFWQWLPLIDSKELLDNVSEKLNNYQKNFLELIEKIFIEGAENGVFNSNNYDEIFKMYIVIIQGTLNSIVVHKDFVNDKTFAESIWNTFWRNVKKEI